MPQTSIDKTAAGLLDPDKHLIFIRAGYLKYYDTRRDANPPQGGGSYNSDGTGESDNFRPWQGRHYIYTRARFEQPLKLQRMGALAGVDQVGRVMVVQVATRPGIGQVVIGWFRNATAYAEWQERPYARKQGCAFIAPEDQAILLPEVERVIHVPKGKGAMGQSQVRYASDTSGRLVLTDWMIDILKKIRKWEMVSNRAARTSSAPAVEPRSPIGQGRGLTKPQRDAVEIFAMARAKEYYETLYDSVVDVHSNKPFDLLCSNCKDGRELRVEVKGTTGSACSVLVTPGEVKSAGTYHTALFIASGLTWADKAAARLRPRAWRRDVIDPWAPSPRELIATQFEWHNPACTETLR